MKKMIFTIATFGLMMTGVAQNEKPTKTENNPDTTTQEKANYNTTRTNKTIKGPDVIKKEQKTEEKTKVGKGGGQQNVKMPFTLLQDKRKITRGLK